MHSYLLIECRLNSHVIRIFHFYGTFGRRYAIWITRFVIYMVYIWTGARGRTIVSRLRVDLWPISRAVRVGQRRPSPARGFYSSRCRAITRRVAFTLPLTFAASRTFLKIVFVRAHKFSTYSNLIILLWRIFLFLLL